MIGHSDDQLVPTRDALPLEEPALICYVLALYVSGSSPHSMRAIANIRALCDLRLGSGYILDVIDIVRFPALAQLHQLIAAPTLIRSHPLPVRRFIGDMSSAQNLFFGLDNGKSLKSHIRVGAA